MANEIGSDITETFEIRGVTIHVLRNTPYDQSIIDQINAAIDERLETVAVIHQSDSKPSKYTVSLRLHPDVMKRYQNEEAVMRTVPVLAGQGTILFADGINPEDVPEDIIQIAKSTWDDQIYIDEYDGTPFVDADW